MGEQIGCASASSSASVTDATAFKSIGVMDTARPCGMATNATGRKIGGWENAEILFGCSVVMRRAGENRNDSGSVSTPKVNVPAGRVTAAMIRALHVSVQCGEDSRGARGAGRTAASISFRQRQTVSSIALFNCNWRQ
jgi:hypothetical protein